MVSWRAGVRARLCAGAALALLPLLAADVVFRVPEVLVRHAAASRPVGTGRANASRANESEPWGAGASDALLEVRYEEYFVEHDVSTADARRAANTLNLDDGRGVQAGVQVSGRLDLRGNESIRAGHCTCVAGAAALGRCTAPGELHAVPATRPGCGACSQRELEYCETRVLADHCCCERRFVREPFPWLPHSCYVGARRCRPLAHDCAQYARLRDCCCYRKLAERWKGILSKSTRVGVSGVSLLLLSMLLFVAYL